MKKKLIAVFGISAMLLTGCSSGVISLDTDEQSTISNYMADILLKYDTNTTHKLLAYDKVSKDGNDEGATPTPAVPAGPADTVPANATVTPEATVEPQASAAPEETAKSEKTESEKETPFTGDYGNGIKVTYKSYSVDEQYENKQSSSYLNLQADSGNQLFITKFTLENTSNDKQTCNLLKKKIDYVLQVNGKEVSSSLVTMLPNDLGTFNKSLDGKSSKEMVLIFNIPKNTKVKTASIHVTKDKAASTIVIK